MNAPTNPHSNHSPGNVPDDKITLMLRQLESAAPTPPAFGDLAGTADSTHSTRPNWINVGAAASIVALGVGGLIILGTRDTAPISEQPGQTIPEIDGTAVPNDSVPIEEPSVGTVFDPNAPEPTVDGATVGTEPDDADPDANADQPQVDTEPIGLGDPLIGAALAGEATPLFEIDQPNWIKQYVYGTDELPLGDTNTSTVVLVGDNGPTFDQPFVTVSVFDAVGMDVAGFGEAVDVNGVASAVAVYDSNPETGLTGSAINLTVPLEGDLALRVNTVQLSLDETIAIAESVSIATLDHVELDAPAGFRQLRGEVPATWRSFSYRWGFDDGTPVPEPVVISTPTAAENIPQQPSIEVIGSNLGAVSLAGRITLEVRENRVVNGIDMAYRPMPDQPGMYWIDWLDGDWSFYVIGENLDSEEQFFELLASLRLTDAETFASSSGVDVVLPGRQNELAAEILDGLGLTDEQLTRAATVTMPTSTYNYQFELYFGLGCVASAAWLGADAAGDDPGRATALAAVDVVIARPDDDATELPSRLGLETLAEPMRAGNAEQVGQFGSNDCPLWSR